MTTDNGSNSGNLPAEPNSFVGRTRDLAELAALLTDVRALTLCGPGGIGKTRLALRLAGELTGALVPDGTWLAELADVRDPALVARRVAAALGIVEERNRPLAETMAAALRPRRMLLVLDTCEHVVEACAELVQQLLASSPGLRVLATSREPLRIRGETVWRVPPLELPAPGSAQSAALTRHEAVRLFAARAASVRPGFAVTADNYDAVARLCRTLDGVPLAIELAAARVRTLAVDQIAARLGDRFQLLASGDRTAPPRQQTLQAAVDWSYELLTGSEQALLRRLSVFSGWGLEMAEQVCADGQIPAGQVLDLLAALIDKSLVTLDGELNGVARYRLLDTIRQFAAEALTASGEDCAVRLRHRDHMLELAEWSAAQAFLRGDPPWPARVAIYRRMSAERANFLTALTVSRELGDADAGLRLCTALANQWIASGDVAEGAGWLGLFLGPDLAAAAGPRVRADALVRRGGLAVELNDIGNAETWAQEGLSLCRSAGGGCEAAALRVLALTSMRAGSAEETLARIDAARAAARAARDYWEEGICLAISATVMTRQGKLDQAQDVFELALEVLRDNNGYGVARVRYGLGRIARARGDQAAALGHFEAALALYREIDARPEIARCLGGIGLVALALPDLELARSSLAECLQLSLDAGQRLAIARSLEALAALAVALGDPARAVRLAGAASSLREAIGDAGAGAVSRQVRQQLDAARAGLGEQAAALLAEGRAMSAYQAAQLAGGIRIGQGPAGGIPAGEPAGQARTAPALRRPAGPDLQAEQGNGSQAASALTGRELEIAGLVARGLSNRGIGEELTISPATVARHVANIFTKLSFKSRAQLAAWAAGRGYGDRPASRSGLDGPAHG